jgi:hypothetical protein
MRTKCNTTLEWNVHAALKVLIRPGSLERKLSRHSRMAEMHGIGSFPSANGTCPPSIHIIRKSAHKQASSAQQICVASASLFSSRSLRAAFSQLQIKFPITSQEAETWAMCRALLCVDPVFMKMGA